MQHGVGLPNEGRVPQVNPKPRDCLLSPFCVDSPICVGGLTDAEFALHHQGVTFTLPCSSRVICSTGLQKYAIAGRMSVFAVFAVSHHMHIHVTRQT